MRVFSNPVKYVDESNNIRDITLKMKENEDGSFSTADNSIITTFPKSIEDGITLEYEDISLKLTPDSNFLKGSISSNIAEDSDNNNESDVSEIVDSSEEMLSGSTTEEESDTELSDKSSENTNVDDLEESEEDSSVSSDQAGTEQDSTSEADPYESDVTENASEEASPVESESLTDDNSEEISQETDEASETSEVTDVSNSDNDNEQVSEASDTVSKVIHSTLSSNAESVMYSADDKTDLEYKLTYTGFKEDIVVREYTGQTDFEFTLETNGLSLVENDGEISLVDGQGETRAFIGNVTVFTADNKIDTSGEIRYREIEPDEKYALTVHLEKSFLTSPETKYPIRIDPWIRVNHSNSSTGIQDVTICSNSSSVGTNVALDVGKRNIYEKERVLMKFPGFDYSNIHSSENIQEATLELSNIYDSNQTSGMAIELYSYMGAVWNESTANWNNVSPNNYSTLLSRKTIKFESGDGITPKRYEFNIKTAVKRWVDGTLSKNQGILIKASDSIENGSTEKYKRFASFNSSSDQPSLSVKFFYGVKNNPYFSKYEPEKYNCSAVTSTGTTNKIRYRMNCYAYAMGFILNNSYEVNLSNLSNPGDRMDPGSLSYSQMINPSPSTSENLANCIFYNMSLDANVVGYTVTKYIPTSGTIPQYGEASRLVAVVTNTDGKGFHFYMQHSDGTWSHKPGNENPRNTSFQTNKIITNDNILNTAKEDYQSNTYSLGTLMFFVVTKSSVLDYLYTGETMEKTLISTTERAGDYAETAISLPNNKTKKLDFNKDSDFYSFVPSVSKTYAVNADILHTYISGDSGSGSLCVIVYSNNGVELSCNSGSTTSKKYINLTSGIKYYFEVANIGTANIMYSLSVT